MRSYRQKGPWNTSNRWTEKEGERGGKRFKRREKGVCKRARLYNPDVFALVLAEMVLLNPPVQSPLWISSASPNPARSQWVLCWTRTSAYPTADNRRTFKKNSQDTRVSHHALLSNNNKHLCHYEKNWRSWLLLVHSSKFNFVIGHHVIFNMHHVILYLPPTLHPDTPQGMNQQRAVLLTKNNMWYVVHVRNSPYKRAVPEASPQAHPSMSSLRLEGHQGSMG